MQPNFLTDSPLSQQPLFELKNVTFSYANSQNQLLDNVSLSLFPGENIGLIGENGCGKSTIIKLLLGLCFPNNGTLNLFGRKVLWGNNYPQLGYIGDPSYYPGELGLPTGILVKELVQIFKSLCQQEKELKDLSYREIEERLQIPSFYESDVSKLSKGQRIRLMAFLALAKKPQLLIADEATEGLDKEGKEIVLSEVQRLANCHQAGILWISHRRDEVARLTDKVYELFQGKLHEQDSQCFDCHIETDSVNAEAKKYFNLSKDGAFQALEEIFTDSSIHKFQMTGLLQKRENL
ncbi:ABC transporter ATP-binding protein [Microcoleus sp. herbarium2]|jgi:ABC-type multidrug transport system ATPase subunit|uniref:ABC transporter ATP-binding protein n=1 Tax=Microcoleus sp. herbarium2 TaxID=3055433 RepID=UPI002FD0A901